MSATEKATNGAKVAVAPGLHTKLAQVMAEVEGVKKDGRNEFHRYDYATAEGILRAMRRPLHERNVVLLPSVTSIEEREYKTEKGKTSVLTTVRMRFRFVDGDSGEAIELDWAGTGDDPADKGLYKAYTGAIRTFLRETFLLPQGDDPEADRRADERGADRATTPKADPVTGEVIQKPALSPDEVKALLKLAKQAISEDGPWTKDLLLRHLVGAGATDTTSVRHGVLTLSPEQAVEFERTVTKALEAHEEAREQVAAELAKIAVPAVSLPSDEVKATLTAEQLDKLERTVEEAEIARAETEDARAEGPS